MKIVVQFTSTTRLDKIHIYVHIPIPKNSEADHQANEASSKVRGKQ